MVLENYIANDYLRAFAVLVGLLIILRIVISIVERIVLRLVKNTKTDLDDILLKRSSMPITIILFFISLKIAIDELKLSELVMVNVNKSIYSALVIFGGYLIYVIIDVIVFDLWKKLGKRMNAKTMESLTSLIHGILKVVLIIFGLIYILDLWGVQVTPLLAGLGIAGLAVALALQPTLANIFSGLAMILDDSVRVGDLVYLDAISRGKIQRIGLRSTKIVTADNELIIVPNSKLADSNIQNIALPEPKSRVVVPFSVSYGSDVEKVKKIVLKEIKTIDHFCSEPEPKVRFMEMGPSSLNFKAYFYVDSFDYRNSGLDEANTKIYNALNKNGISMPFPQMDVHLKRN